MFVVITYDVNTQTKQGQRRLAKMARQCVNYGVRVQNSVFECIADFAKWREIKQKLIDIIDQSSDSLRFYYLGDNYKTKIEHIGNKEAVKMDEPLIL